MTAEHSPKLPATAALAKYVLGLAKHHRQSHLAETHRRRVLLLSSAVLKPCFPAPRDQCESLAPSTHAHACQDCDLLLLATESRMRLRLKAVHVAFTAGFTRASTVTGQAALANFHTAATLFLTC